jgi:hypothetical protein
MSRWTKFVQEPEKMGYPPINGLIAVFPAIAIPVEKKDEFACPQTFVVQLVQLLRQVSKILVVGWRASEDHFLNMLGNPITGLRPRVSLRIVVGSRASADETRDRICEALSKNMPVCYGDSDSFTDFLDSGHAKEFLES